MPDFLLKICLIIFITMFINVINRIVHIHRCIFQMPDSHNAETDIIKTEGQSGF